MASLMTKVRQFKHEHSCHNRLTSVSGHGCKTAESVYLHFMQYGLSEQIAVCHNMFSNDW